MKKFCKPSFLPAYFQIKPLTIIITNAHKSITNEFSKLQVIETEGDRK